MKTREIHGMSMSCNGEHTDTKGYLRCNKCGEKLMLVTTSGYFKVDEEAFKPGEGNPEGLVDEVFVGEVSGHWCGECEMLVSLTYNYKHY